MGIKNFLIIVFGVLLLLAVSCKKEEKPLHLFGKWVLTDGYLYVTNLETGEKTYYHHFGEGKTVSQLSGFNKPKFELEKIEINKTTWEFKKNMEFILNDNVDSPLYINVVGDNWTIIEHPTTGITMLGGSSRPFRAYSHDYKNNIIEIDIQEQYGSYKGYNVQWSNILYFKKISDN